MLNGMQVIDDCPVTESKHGRKDAFEHWRWPMWNRRRHTRESVANVDNTADVVEETSMPESTPLDDIETTSESTDDVTTMPDTNADDSQRDSFIQTIVDDFRPGKGDQKILRAIGRTASVNAAVLLTAVTGGAAAATGVGLGVGGAITAKRAADGIVQKDEKEVVKSLSVFGAATGASIGAQAVTGAVLIGLGAALPVAAAVAFGAGCTCGITAGALSEWTVDGVIDKVKKKKSQDNESLERSKSDGELLRERNNHVNQQYNFKRMKSEGIPRRSKRPMGRRSRSEGIPRRSRRPSGRKDIPRHLALKRCHSDGLIAHYNKYCEKRNVLPRRNSCIF